MYKPQYPGLYYFDSFTFTSLGASGHEGPESSRGYANAPWRPGDFSIQDGQQYWTVPTNGTYQITAAGAYGAAPGRVVTGQVNLGEGQQVRMLVGQCPTPLTANVEDNVTVGGGGGTWISTGDKLLMVASGGDGGSYKASSWSLPVHIMDNQFPVFMNDAGTKVTICHYGPGISGLYEFNGSTWNSIASFPNMYPWWFSDTVIYAISGPTPTTLRITEFTYQQTIIKYTDLNVPLTSFATGFSRDGQTFVIPGGTYPVEFAYVYRRENGDWVYKATLDGPVAGSGLTAGCVSMSEDGNRIVTTSYDGSFHFRVYDYPWTSYTDHVIYDNPSHGCLSLDGTLLVTVNNVYSASTGSVITSLPGFTFQSQAYTQISKDNKTIFKGTSGTELYVIDYSTPTPVTSKIFQATTFLDFYLAPVINQDGTVIAVTNILYNADIYYKSQGSQSGIFLPSGTGQGISGAGYLTDGEATNPYFNFFKPKAYIDGGFGNQYEYGSVPYRGGFGGGQSPLNKLNDITAISGTSTETVLTSTNMGSVGLNKDGTVLYFRDTTTIYRYVYSSGSWSLDFSTPTPSSTQTRLFSVSDDGNTCVTSVRSGLNDDYSMTLIQGTTVSQRTGTVGCVSSDGSTFAYTDTSPSVYINDQNINVSFPSGVEFESCSLSSNGKILALGGIKYVGNSYYRYTYVIRYPWTTLETIPLGLYGGTLVSLSRDGNTLFATSRRVTQAEKIQVFKYTAGTWTLFTESDYSVRFLSTLATCYDGTVFAGTVNETGYPGNPDFRMYLFDYTGADLNQFETKASSDTFSAISSNGQKLLVGTSTTLTLYTKQNVTANTNVVHGFPHEYRVNFDLTSNYNGLHDITVVSSNTFTFQGFGSVSESGTVGTVSGIATGISGGGGYTGSPGDGVSGATCYADASVTGFTDLGAASNTNGYVTVSLIDPVPLQQVSTWSDRTNWNLRGIQLKNCEEITWNGAIGKFIGINIGILPTVQTSPDGILWSYVDSSLSLLSIVYQLMSTEKGTTLLYQPTGVYVTRDAVTWTQAPIADFTFGASGSKLIEAQSNVYFFNGTGTVSISGDGGYTWSVPQITFAGFSGVAYGNEVFAGICPNTPYVWVSVDGVSWTLTDQNTQVTTPETIAFADGLFMISGKGEYFNGVTTEIRTYVSHSPIVPLGNMVTSNVYQVYRSGNNFVSFDSTTWIKTGNIPGLYVLPVAYGNGRFVGTSSGGILNYAVSLDGILWSRIIQYGTQYRANTPKSIVYANGRFVAVGREYSPAAIVSLDGGITWTPGNISTNPPYIWVAVTYGNGLFVAVGYTNPGGRGITSTSVDGITWTSPQVSDTEYTSLNSVTFGNGYFVAAGDHIFAKSTDGVTWNTFSSGVNWIDVSYGNGLFVAISVSGNYIATSSDGETWSEVYDTSVTRDNVTYGNGLFLINGYTTGYLSLPQTNMIQTSPDGITWTIHLIDSIGYGGQGGPGSSSIGFCQKIQAESWSTSIIGHASVPTWMDNSLTQIASRGSSIIGINSSNVWYSPDGVTWSQSKNRLNTTLKSTIAVRPDYFALTDGEYTYLTLDGQYVVCPVTSTISPYQIVYSSDLGLYVATGEGIVSVSGNPNEWTSVDVPLLTGVSAIEWSPRLGIFVAYCYEYVFISNDGYNWVTYDGPSISLTFGHKALVWSETLGLFTLAGKSVSKDGINWSTPSGSVVSPIAWSPTLERFTSGRYYSSDGLNWTSTGVSFTANSIAWSDTLELFTCVDDTSYYTSSDGVTWSSNIFEGGTQRFMVTYNSPSYVYTSEDNGVTVTTTNMFDVLQSYNVIVQGFTISDDGTIYVLAVDNTYPTSYPIVKSTDLGQTWTVAGTLDSSYNFSSWRRIVYGDGKLVIWALNGDYAFANNDVAYVAVSTDNGSTWTYHQRFPGYFYPMDFIYANGLFIAVSTGTATSTDGINWTKHENGVTGLKLGYGNGVFILTNVIGSPAVQTSPDGITWTPRTVPGTGFYAVMEHDGALYTLDAFTGTIIKTTDSGATWTIVGSAPAGLWVSLSYVNGTYVVYGLSGSVVGATSSDLNTWTVYATPDLSYPGDIHYGAKVQATSYTSPVIDWSPELKTFLVSGTRGSSTYVYTSTDGVSFTNEGTFQGLNQPLTCLAHSSNTFVSSDGSAFFVSQPFTRGFQG